MLEIDEWPNDAARKREFGRKLKGDDFVLIKVGGKVCCLRCSINNDNPKEVETRFSQQDKDGPFAGRWRTHYKCAPEGCEKLGPDIDL